MIFYFKSVYFAVLFFASVATQGQRVVGAKHCTTDSDNDTTCTNNDNIPPGQIDPIVRQYIMALNTDKHFINGTWIRPSSDDESTKISLVDPSTGKEIASIATSTKKDIDVAVEAAREALENWSIETSLEERRKLVSRLLHLYNEHDERMAQLISHEMGCPIEYSRDAQVGSGSFVIRQFLQETGEDGGFEESYELDEDTTIIHEAIGVVASITPWNWPMNQIANKVIPALLVGCTVILKPSEQTPLSAMLFSQMIDTAGFPRGTFQLVNGYGKDHVGEWLASHPGIDMVSLLIVASTVAPNCENIS